MHELLVRQRLRRVGAGDPHDLDLAGAYSIEHLHRGPSRFRGHLVHSPELRDLAPVLLVAEIAVSAKQVGHAADFPSAHRVGLAGQAERPGAGFADLPGGEVQVDEGGVLRRAAGGLIEALAVEGEGRFRTREYFRRFVNVRLGDAANGRGPLQRGFTCDLPRRFEILGVQADVALVAPALPQHEVQHAVEEHDVGAWRDLQMQRRRARGLGLSRVDDDQVLRLRLFDPPEENRMSPSGVAASDEDAFRRIDVLVAGGRRVRAERLLVARRRGRHA